MKKIRFSISFFALCLFSSHFVNAQCFPERHSTNWFDGWISCETAPNPNTDRGMTHWIMYDLDDVHKLDRTYIWNINDPSNLNRGIRQMAVDYSVDGANWTFYGNFNIEPASGRSIYEGSEGPDLSGIEARFLLVTALSNYGGDCFGFSEIRIEAENLYLDVEDTQTDDCLRVDIYPNPFLTSTKAYLNSDCYQEINYRMVDVFGRIIKEGVIPQDRSQDELSIDGENLSAGNYFLEFEFGDQIKRSVMVKM